MDLKDAFKKDTIFLEMCNLVSNNSKCLSRKVGSVLVKDGAVISTGYNGPPRNIPHCWERYIIDPTLRKKMEEIGKDPDDPENHKICPRYVMNFKSGEGLGWCVAGHGERNSLINAARLGISTDGTTMYMSCATPCSPCLIEIINAGVVEIVTNGTFFYDESAEYLIKNCDLIVRRYHSEPNFLLGDKK